MSLPQNFTKKRLVCFTDTDLECELNNLKNCYVFPLVQVDYDNNQSISLGIFPPFHVQTLVSLSDNISSVGWSCCTYSLSFLWMFLFTNVEFLVSGAKDLSQGLPEQLCIMWSVSIDYDSHNCRQTYRNAGGAEYTQTVTLKRTYIIVAAFWVVILVSTLCFVLDPQIPFW